VRVGNAKNYPAMLSLVTLRSVTSAQQSRLGRVSPAAQSAEGFMDIVFDSGGLTN
jgi:hypothetical protein